MEKKENFWKSFKRMFAFKRRFEAGKIDRRSNDFVGSYNNINQDIFRDAQIMRNRARDLEQNNPFAKKILQTKVNNIVGPYGFLLNVKSFFPDGTSDVDANQATEKAWKEFSNKKNADITKKHSLTEMSRIIVNTVERDGEILVRKIKGNTSINKFGFSLQLISNDRFSYLYNDFKGKNKIEMSVEYDDFGTPVAYYVLKNTGSVLTTTFPQGGSIGDFERIPADEIIHLFKSKTPEQRRGYSGLHAVILSLKNLDGYQQAELINARVAASKMLFFKRTDNLPASPHDIADRKNDLGEFISDVSPGQASILPNGYEIQEFSPDYPSNYAEYIKSVLRQVASGSGVSYETLANDREGVNFSSIRAGLLEERDNYIAEQNWLIENFYNEIYEEFLKMGLLNGAITTKNGGKITPDKFEKLKNFEFKGRRWGQVNPLQEVMANVLAIDNNLASPEQIVGENGQDIEDIYAEIASNANLREKLGIKNLSEKEIDATATNNEEDVKNIKKILIKSMIKKSLEDE